MVNFPNSRHRSSCPRQGERGYVLLALVLAVTLLIIAAAVAAPTIAFEIKRDREQEMIHRGVQYSRAIRNYYKKFGRYPTRLEDLDNTNNLRYLRKHYKDPITGQDFKLLHYGDPGVTMTGSIGSTTIPGANSVGAMNGSPGNSAFGSGSSGSAFSQSSGFGGNSNSAFGGNSGGGFAGGSTGGFGGGFGNSANSGTSSFNNNSASNTNTNQPGGTDPSQSGTSTAQDSSTTQSGPGGANGQGNNQVFGGGPIVGVASTSKKDTIRQYNKKKKYNEWQFVYDPTTDRGGLLTTPYQPQLQGFGSQPLQNGQNGQPGSTGTNGSAFGSPTGFGNNSPGLMGGPSTPTQQPSNPPQQQ